MKNPQDVDPSDPVRPPERRRSRSESRTRSTTESRGRSPRWRAPVEVAIGLLLVFAPLALGSAPPWTLWPLTLVALAAAVVTLVGVTRVGGGLAFPVLALVPALGAVLCLAQLIPLPSALLHLLSPQAAELRDFALVPLGLDRARPISLDPSATWREFAKQLAYLSAFLCSVQLSRSPRSARRLLQIVAAVGVALALTGIGHLVLDEHRLFGLYGFISGGPPLITPFGNPNHLAAYLTLAGTVALGLALSTADRQRALLWGLGYLIIGAAVMLSLSRGGIVFFLFAQLLFGALLLRRRTTRQAEPGPEGSPLSLALAAFLAMVLVVGLGGFIAYEKLGDEVATVDTVDKLSHSKIELWPMLAEGSRHFWLAGMGRGAFEVAFTRYQTGVAGNTLTHPENALFQLGSELGLPATLATLALLGVGGIRLLRRRELLPTDLALLAALLALGLHDLFDFSLEFPATALTAWVLWGVVARPGNAEVLPRARRQWLVPALGLFSLATLALWLGRSTVLAAEATLERELLAGASPRALRRQALTLIDQHPADYALYDMMGQAFASQRPTEPIEALAFVNRALYLRPIDPVAHGIAARSLLGMGKRSQAFLEYRLAKEASETPVAVLDEALGFARGLRELQALISPEPVQIQDLVLRLRARGRADESHELLSWALEELSPQPALASLWVMNAGFQADERKVDAALASVEHALTLDPHHIPAQLLKANLLARDGKHPQAIASLQALVTQFPGNTDVAFTLAGQLIGLGKFRLAREALGRVLPFINQPNARVELFSLEGRTWEQERHYARALASFQTALRIFPDNPQLHYQVARAHEALEHFSEALEELRAGLKLDSPAASVAQKPWIDRLEKAEKERLARREQRLREGDPLLTPDAPSRP